MRFLVLILVAAAATAGSASAGSSYYPKRAYFRMSVSGTQTTSVKVTTACQDENGHDTPKTASGTETLRFKTGKPGRVLFKTDAHGGMIVFQEDASFEDGVRPARATGSVERSSGLDNQRGSSAPDCGFGGAASRCGAKPVSGGGPSPGGPGPEGEGGP